MYIYEYKYSFCVEHEKECTKKRGPFHQSHRLLREDINAVQNE